MLSLRDYSDGTVVGHMILTRDARISGLRSSGRRPYVVAPQRTAARNRNNEQHWYASMTEKPDTDVRLTELEARISFQDDIIEKLNATVIEPWEQIELQARQISALNERLQEAEQRGMPVRNEPPPHY